MTAEVRQSRPGGRSARVRAAVLAATLDELAESGFSGLTIENIAVRAGVHKTTIYRRWETPRQLVFEAATSLHDAEAPIPDTGSIETDLRIFIRDLARLLSGQPGAKLIATIFSEASRFPEIRSMKRQFWAGRIQLAESMVTRALARGELPAGTDAAEVIQALAAPLHYRLLVTGQPVDDQVADRVAIATLTAARSGAFRPSTG